MGDEQTQEMPVLDAGLLTMLGQRLFTKFSQYKTDRKPLEDQWLKNLRQFRGIYDPEIEGVLAKDRSRAYPKITRQKVVGMVSRLMEMLFPQSEKNYGISPTPMPDLAVADLQAILDTLSPPADGSTPDLVAIEKAVMELASARCDKMSTTIDDQLSELDYVALARRVIFSGVLYGPGIAKGPLVKTKKQNEVRFDQLKKKFIAHEVERMFPYFDFMEVWSYYPDLSAKKRTQQDDYFERHVMSREQVAELAKRKDFMQDRVLEWLRNNPSGNFKELWWETMLRTNGDKSNQSNLTGRKYEGGEYWGYCSGHELRAAGIKIDDTQLSDMYEASVFMLDNVVVKCILNPYNKKRRPDHVFVFEDDDISLMGSGLPPVVRDSQMAICEAARMALDNASVVCGPILEGNVSLLVPGQDLSLHSYKIFWREDEDRAGVPAIREVKIESHIQELTSLIELFNGFADTETAMMPISQGDISKGGSEAMRTQGNASMLMSAASLPIRDTVRNFDLFTESFIGSLVDWNMQFNPDPAIKGDFVTLARGSTSLIAKEVRAYALDNFKMSLTPDEVVYIKTGMLLKERAKSRDIPMEIFEDDAVVQQKQQAQSAVAQQQQAQQSALAEATVKKVLTEALKNAALAKKADTGASTDIFEVLMKAVNDANQPEPVRKAA